MFVIGFIVGFILGAVAIVAVSTLVVPKMYGMTLEEYKGSLDLVYDGGHNRESSLILVKDDTIVNEVVYKE